MVARSAPSRPIRVTVTFANRLDHRCFACLRVGGAFGFASARPAAKRRQAGQVGKRKISFGF